MEPSLAAAAIVGWSLLTLIWAVRTVAEGMKGTTPRRIRQRRKADRKARAARAARLARLEKDEKRRR